MPGHRVNFLLICTDQQHWRAAGREDSFFVTPSLDALARESVVFSHAFCTTPQCSPSRASLYTGLYPHRTGVAGNTEAFDHNGNRVPPLSCDQATIADYLAPAGYMTGYFGKWHLGNEACHAARFTCADLGSDSKGDDHVTDQALRFLQSARSSESPFALFVNYRNPHDIYHINRGEPLSHPEDATQLPNSYHEEAFSGKPEPHSQFMSIDQGKVINSASDSRWRQYRELYREKVRLVDTEVGRLMAGLDQAGKLEDTVVFFTSDHGDMDTNHRLIFKGPFMYEHLLRIPLMIRLPRNGGWRDCTKTDGMAVIADLVPTMVELAGLSAPVCDGVSWASYLTGRDDGPQRDYVVCEYYSKQRWVNPIRTIRTRTHKYNLYIDHGEELYNLVTDPDELRNLADDSEHAVVKSGLRQRLDSWIEQTQDPFYSLKTTPHPGLAPQIRKGD